MQALDPSTIGAFPHGQRAKNVFRERPEFKARIVLLGPRGGYRSCHTAQSVLFALVRGQVTAAVDSDSTLLGEGQCLITDPAAISMRSEQGATRESRLPRGGSRMKVLRIGETET